jgi:hypothetical protein
MPKASGMFIAKIPTAMAAQRPVTRPAIKGVILKRFESSTAPSYEPN